MNNLNRTKRAKQKTKEHRVQRNACGMRNVPKSEKGSDRLQKRDKSIAKIKGVAL